MLLYGNWLLHKSHNIFRGPSMRVVISICYKNIVLESSHIIVTHPKQFLYHT